jgi:hypothetical protein
MKFMEWNLLKQNNQSSVTCIEINGIILILRGLHGQDYLLIRLAHCGSIKVFESKNLMTTSTWAYSDSANS